LLIFPCKSGIKRWNGGGGLTFEAMIELAWQIMLYTAAPMVRVRTVPALREVRLTETR
jgi:hypothetical protein